MQGLQDTREGSPLIAAVHVRVIRFHRQQRDPLNFTGLQLYSSWPFALVSRERELTGKFLALNTSGQSMYALALARA